MERHKEPLPETTDERVAIRCKFKSPVLNNIYVLVSIIRHSQCFPACGTSIYLPYPALLVFNITRKFDSAWK
jgi:hypothetical protein